MYVKCILKWMKWISTWSNTSVGHWFTISCNVNGILALNNNNEYCCLIVIEQEDSYSWIFIIVWVIFCACIDLLVVLSNISAGTWFGHFCWVRSFLEPLDVTLSKMMMLLKCRWCDTRENDVHSSVLAYHRAYKVSHVWYPLSFHPISYIQTVPTDIAFCIDCKSYMWCSVYINYFNFCSSQKE